MLGEEDEEASSVSFGSGTSADPEQDGGKLTITRLPGGIGLRLSGDVDISNHLQLRGALNPLPADARTSVHLELSGLRFIDLAGTRELIWHLHSHQRSCLVLLDPPASLMRIITLLWPGANVEIRITRP